MKKLFYILILIQFLITTSYSMDLGEGYLQELQTSKIRVARHAAEIAKKRIKNIYQKSTINPQYNTSVNLLWVGRNCNQDFQYIFPASNEYDLYEKFINPAFKWAEKNPSNTQN